MGLTPVEIRHITFGRGLLGYKRSAVDRLLGDIADSFEDVWRDRADQLDRVEQLEQDLVRYRELETLLRATLVSAERAAHALRDDATREAEQIVAEAKSEARGLVREARAEREGLDTDARRVRSLLRSALGAVDEAVASLPEPQHGEAEQEAAERPGRWEAA
jgi:cell division initiation protein